MTTRRSHVAQLFRAVLVLGLILLASPAQTEARSLRLTTDPPSASIFLEDQAGGRLLLGSGSAELRLRRGETSRVVVEAEGWEAKAWELSREQRGQSKTMTLTLENRLVALGAVPHSALIVVDGDVAGEGETAVLVPRGKTVQVEVKLAGYATVTREYAHTQAADPLPVKDLISLETRVVAVTAEPKEAQILVDGSGLGQGAATVEIHPQTCVQVRVEAAGYVARDVEYCQGSGSDLPIEDSITLQRALIVDAKPSGTLLGVDGGEPKAGPLEVPVPSGGCVTVEAVRSGFVPLERVFCVQEGMPEPPRDITLELTDRIVRVGVAPPGARILVDGEEAGIGEYTLAVAMGSCRRVEVTLDGHLPQQRDICYETPDVYPPQVLQVDLEEDEAWAKSIAEPSVNREVILAPAPGLDFEAAWRTLGITILASFDVIEVTDRDIGYLRTAWQVREFERSTVRTRIIVKQSSITPVRFAVKLVSERSVDGGDSFAPWDRLLLDYRDLLPTLVSRLTSGVEAPGADSPPGELGVSEPQEGVTRRETGEPEPGVADPSPPTALTATTSVRVGDPAPPKHPGPSPLDSRSANARTRLKAQTGHEAEVTATVLSPDGKQVLTGDESGTVLLWNARTGQELQRFDGHGQEVWSVAFSAGGDLVLTGSEDTTARLWDALTGQELQRFEGHESDVDSVAISPDGDRVLTVSGGEAYLWDADTGQELHRFEYGMAVAFSADGEVLTSKSDSTAGPSGRHADREMQGFEVPATDRLSSVAASPEGRRVLTVSDKSKMVRLWDARTGQEIQRFVGHADLVMAVAFSPDGERVLTADGPTARLWDARKGQVKRFVGHTETVVDVAFSPDGERVLTGSADELALLWDARTGKEIQRFGGDEGGVWSVAFSRDGERVLTGSDYGGACLWEARTGKEIQCIDPDELGYLTSVALLGDRVLMGDRDGAALLWDVETGKQVKSYEDYPLGTVTSVAFSPDGGLVLTGHSDDGWEDNGRARLWDAETGEEVGRFEVEEDEVTSVAFSPDGELVLTGSSGRESWGWAVRLWDVRTGREKVRFEGHTDVVSFVAYFEEKVITASRDKTARVWDAKTGDELGRINLPSDAKVTSVTFSPDRHRLLTGSDDGIVRLWDLDTGEEVKRFEAPKHSEVRSVAFSPDGKLVLSGDWNAARLWDLATGEEVQRFEGNTKAAAFSADGERLLTTGSTLGWAYLWDVDTGEKLRRFGGHSDSVNSVAFSPNGERVLTGSEDGTARLWDAGTGQEATRIGIGDFEYPISVAFSPDGKRVLMGGLGITARLWDARTGEEVRRFVGHREVVLAVAFSADGERVLTGSLDRTARLWDAHTGREIQRFEGHGNMLLSVAFSADGERVLTGSYDGTARLWDTRTGKELAQLLAFNDGTWAVVDAEGRFDASNGGDVLGLHWVVGLEPISLSQLKERYYEPGLLAKIMGFTDEPLRTVEAFNEHGVELFPEMTIDHLPEPADTELRFRLTNRGGGIGKVAVLVNGKEMVQDARPENADPGVGELEIRLDMRNSRLFVPGEDNEIEIVAYNQEGYLASRGPKRVARVSEEKAALPRLWALVVGVSDYSGSEIDLRYAAKDAGDFAAALKLAAEGLFPGRVQVTSLVDGSVTRAGLDAELAKIAGQAEPTDLLVVYLAGHGVTTGGVDEGDFYYLLQEAQTLSLEDRLLREQTAISSRDLIEKIKAIPALKQVLVLDTCAAGQLVEDLGKSRAVSSSQIRALDRLKDRTGMFVLAGSAADAVSYETSRFGQGLLTYTLLRGMRGAALREEQFLDVSEWFSYSADQVPQLAEGIGGIQQPRRFGDGESFDLGRLTAESRALVPLAELKPVVLRSNFQDEEQLIDSLALAAAVDEVLRDASSRASEAPLVFVDAESYPGGHRLVGRYSVNGERVVVTVHLSLDGEAPHVFEEEGSAEAIEDLAARIVSRAESLLMPNSSV